LIFKLNYATLSSHFSASSSHSLIKSWVENAHYSKREEKWEIKKQSFFFFKGLLPAVFFYSAAL